MTSLLIALLMTLSGMALASDEARRESERQAACERFVDVGITLKAARQHERAGEILEAHRILSNMVEAYRFQEAPTDLTRDLVKLRQSYPWTLRELAPSASPPEKSYSSYNTRWDWNQGQGTLTSPDGSVKGWAEDKERVVHIKYKILNSTTGATIYSNSTPEHSVSRLAPLLYPGIQGRHSLLFFLYNNDKLPKGVILTRQGMPWFQSIILFPGILRFLGMADTLRS